MAPVISLVFHHPWVLSDPVCLSLVVFCVVCHVLFPALVLSLFVFSSVMHISCFILYTYLSSHSRHFTSCPCVFPACLMTCSAPISFTCSSLVHSPVSDFLIYTPYINQSPSLCSSSVCLCVVFVFQLVPLDSVPVCCPCIPDPELSLKVPISASALPLWSVSCIWVHPAPTCNTAKAPEPQRTLYNCSLKLSSNWLYVYRSNR